MGEDGFTHDVRLCRGETAMRQQRLTACLYPLRLPQPQAQTSAPRSQPAYPPPIW